MTLLPATFQSPSTGTRFALLVTTILLTAGFAGCIGDDDSNDQTNTTPGTDTDTSPPDGLKVHLAATGSPSSGNANVSTVGVTLSDEPQTQFLLIQNRQLDLAALASSSDSVLVGYQTDLSGTATRTAISFESFTVDGTALGSTSLSLPLEHEAGDDVNVTITLDLAATASAGELRIDQVVAQRGSTQLGSITQDDLDALNAPLPSPEILAGTGPNMTIANQTLPSGNGTVKTVPVNTELNFTYELPDINTDIRTALWVFGDNGTGTGTETSHAYRTPGFYQVRLIVEDTRGRQAFANTTIDVSMRASGSDSILMGTAGAGQVEDRDVKTDDVAIPGNFTSVSLRLDQEAGCDGCPANVHVELYNPDGELVGENTTSEDTKWINLTGMMSGGDWEITVRGDQGTTVSYSWELEVHHAGLCAEAGGVEGFECLSPVEPIEGSSGPV